MANHQNRLQKLRAIMAESDLSAAAFIPSPNFFYLTGAKHLLMERPLILLIPLEGTPTIVIPSLEADLFTSHGFAAEIFAWDDAEGYDDALHAALDTLALDSGLMGVEGLKMRFFEAEALRRHAPHLTVTDASDTLGRLRIHKDKTEIGYIRKAVEIAEQALEKTLSELRLGMTEKQIAHVLENHMAALGGEGLPFDSLVLAGGMSANPHGHPRPDYKLQNGDTLLFDFGTTYKGYCSDITRTFFVGSVTDHQRAIYEAVKAANEAGRKAIKVGDPIGIIDEAARQALIDAGFEHLIKHRTGHGMGIDPHELPTSVSYVNRDPQEVGMVFTVEPGLYDKGVVGVRIEDDMVVTDNGGESLTTFSRDLQILPLGRG